MRGSMGGWGCFLFPSAVLRRFSCAHGQSQVLVFCHSFFAHFGAFFPNRFGFEKMAIHAKRMDEMQTTMEARTSAAQERRRRRRTA
jgi:hypothetical protein